MTARAQTGDLTSRVRALEPMINELKANAADVKLISQIRQALSDILALDPANQEGLNGMMTVSLLAKQPLEARQWAFRIVAQYPREKTSYYCVATTDWSVIYNAVTAARAAAGMRPEDTNSSPMPRPAAHCAISTVLWSMKARACWRPPSAWILNIPTRHGLHESAVSHESQYFGKRS